MDGDSYQRSLRLTTSNGSMIYVGFNNIETNRTMNIFNDAATWEAGLLKDIDELRKNEPNFRICIVSQSSKQAMSINEGLLQQKVSLVEDQFSGRLRPWSDQEGIL